MKTLRKVLLVLFAVTLLTGCGSKKDDKVIKVGATAIPHAMVLNDVVKDILAKDGWTLEVVEFTDYVTPNTSLEEGELDANYFQTLGYLNDQNESRGLHLVPVQGVHYEPMQIFSKNYTAVSDFAEGDAIAIPNDFDNEKRALTVVSDAGLIEYDPELVAADGSPLDGIVSNPLGLEFKEVEAANVPQANDDVAGLVVNGNYALEANLKDKSNSLFVEVPDIEARTNYLVVKEGNEETDQTKALIKAITDPSVKDYIAEHYGSAVVPVF